MSDFLFVSIRDHVAKRFLQPTLFRTQPEAIRAFKHSLEDQNGPFFRSPSDFELCVLGQFDEDTGVITANVEPIVIVRGRDLVPAPSLISSVA